jgi:hypothetical protein
MLESRSTGGVIDVRSTFSDQIFPEEVSGAHKIYLGVSCAVHGSWSPVPWITPPICGFATTISQLGITKMAKPTSSTILGILLKALPPPQLQVHTLHHYQSRRDTTTGLEKWASEWNTSVAITVLTVCRLHDVSYPTWRTSNAGAASIVIVSCNRISGRSTRGLQKQRSTRRCRKEILRSLLASTLASINWKPNY